MVIEEKWLVSFAVNDIKNDVVLRIYNKIFDHEPTEKDLFDEMIEDTSKVFYGKVCVINVIGWQKMRAWEEKKT